MKKIRNILVLLLSMSGVFTSCEEDYTYYEDSKTTVHFKYKEGENDMKLSFITHVDGKPIERAFPLEIAGYASDRDRTVELEIVDENTTAVKDVHYNLPDRLTFRGGRYHDTLKITFYNTDPVLENEERRLYIRIKANDDFDNGIHYLQHLDIHFTNEVQEPVCWGNRNVYSYMYYYFGTYSKMKHRYILVSNGIEELPDRYISSFEDRVKFNNWSIIANNYFRDNVVLENPNDPNSRIMPWK